MVGLADLLHGEREHALAAAALEKTERTEREDEDKIRLKDEFFLEKVPLRRRIRGFAWPERA